jgi:hypothetical protein
MTVVHMEKAIGLTMMDRDITLCGVKTTLGYPGILIEMEIIQEVDTHTTPTDQIEVGNQGLLFVKWDRFLYQTVFLSQVFNIIDLRKAWIQIF